ATASMTGSGTAYTVTLTPLAEGTVSVAVPAGAFTNGGGITNTASNTASATYDSTPPTVSIGALSGPTAGKYTATITLSESSNDFTAGDLAVVNATATLTGSGTTYTVTLTPVADGTVSVTVPAGGFTDGAGNANTASNTASAIYDATAPTVTISALSGPTSGKYTATITLSEASTDFVVGDLTLVNATATMTGSGTTYTVTLTPVADGTVSVTVPAGAFTDGAGNPNTASNTASAIYDATAPTVTISALSGPTSGKYTATISLSEASTDFTIGDLTLVNATASMIGSGTAYTVTLTPVADGTVSVTVPAGAFTDGAGNANSASNTSSANYVSGTPLTLTPRDGWKLKLDAFTPIDQAFEASGGVAPYAYKLTGDLPEGVRFDASQGRLVGAAREAGRFTITLTVSDSATPHAGKLVNTYAIAVNRLSTAVTLVSSANPILSGEAVTFTATVAPATALGSVSFSIDGVEQPSSVVLAGGTASFTADALAAGRHRIVARYLGDDAHSPARSDALMQVVQAPGSVVIRQRTDGEDGVFAFRSDTPELNLSIQTQTGRGESPALSLVAGTYAVTAADMRAKGIALTGIACSDDDSRGDIDSRTAVIKLAAGEKVVCTFTSVNSRDKTTNLIGEFLDRRADLILTNLPGVQRRVDRLKGVSPTVDDPVSSLMSYLPGVVKGGRATVSSSLGALDALAGNQTPRRFDAWIEGSFALFDDGSPDGTFQTASFGADYLVSPNLLIGAFAQIDHLSQKADDDATSVSGTGWLAGPYMTTRLSDNVYLDVLAGIGTSRNTVSPYGTYKDGFDTSRWAVSAALQGDWQWDDWTFSPRLRASYFEERMRGYTDSLGVDIPAITTGLGQVAIGPGIGYRFTTDNDMAIDTELRFEGIADILTNTESSGIDNLRGRVEGSIDVTMPGGARLGLTAAYDGIGSDKTSASAVVKLSVPLQ
ncbi:Ig-like domain-containing protein, partial [Ciceribacter sp. L1K22]|uniref:Ig-like domain-containing protein n=1 Tax=Ciceribacter sp. L1K22 TaxID=2820275 RepID=UPI001ABE9B03